MLKDIREGDTSEESGEEREGREQIPEGGEARSVSSREGMLLQGSKQVLQTTVTVALEEVHAETTTRHEQR